ASQAAPSRPEKLSARLPAKASDKGSQAKAATRATMERRRSRVPNVVSSKVAAAAPQSAIAARRLPKGRPPGSGNSRIAAPDARHASEDAKTNNERTRATVRVIVGE